MRELMLLVVAGTLAPPEPLVPGADEVRDTLGAPCEDEDEEMRDGCAFGYGDETPRTLPVVDGVVLRSCPRIEPPDALFVELVRDLWLEFDVELTEVVDPAAS